MDVIRKFEPLFGDWHVESFIGAGSFGRVYKIYRDELGDRFYSALKYISIPSEENEVKQLRADGMDNASISTYYGSLAQNIRLEITLMNKLKGKTNIVSFEDSRILPKPTGIGYDIFIRMELLESLTNRIAEKPLPVEEIVKLGKDICSALILCTEYRIIHRDIKPDNIFISPDGDYKLGDFGIARQLEKTSTFMSKKGTPNYMAPEVYKGEEYGATCDIYSLGLVMYRLLNNGRLPFLPPAPEAITPDDKESSIVRRMRGEPLLAPRGGSEALKRIVLKACAYDPHVRYQSAEEMKRDLEQIGTGAFVRTGNVGYGSERVYADTDETVRAQGTEYIDAQTNREKGAVTETAARERVFCPYCGKPHKSVGSFCVFCGKPISANEKRKNVVTAQSSTENQKKKDRRILWIILALLLLTVVVTTVIIVVLVSSRCEDAEEDRTTWIAPPTLPSETQSPVPETEPPTADPETPTPTPTADPETPTPTPTADPETPTPTPTKKSTPTPTLMPVCLTPTPTPTPKPNVISEPTPWVEGSWSWRLNNGVLTIYGKGNIKEFDFNGSPWYDNRKNIKQVVIEHGITGIGSYAFYDCSSLKSITIPSGVTSIGERAFKGCSSLTNITIPNGVTSIGERAFWNCRNLISVTMPDSVTSIGSYIFYECTSLTSVTIPSGVTNISDFAFNGCSSLKNVTIPSGVTRIGESAFYECSSLSSIAIPNSVRSIGEYAFYGCKHLASVTIPNGVTSIGIYTFGNCSGLKSVTIPGSVTSIGKNAFRECSSLKDVYFKGSMTQWMAISIGKYNGPLQNAAIHYNSN